MTQERTLSIPLPPGFAGMAAYRRHGQGLLMAVALLGLAIGGGLWWFGEAGAAGRAWMLATLPVLAALAAQIVTSLRRGDVGLDIVAALSMSVALALGESLAANVVALMYAGGQMLEAFAEGRAHREMTALLGRVAHSAMRYRDSGLEEVPIEAIRPGDRLLIRKGEVLPVDGHVGSVQALLDLSALTGESLPQDLRHGDEALSGATLVGAPFDLIASRPASESTYAGIVRLVEQAKASRAPMARLADRYAVVFLILTLSIAALAWWLAEDPVRVLAVLVVATPCPLILAVPVAIISGMSRSAKIGALIKSGSVLEACARVTTAVLDKTGTLTQGHPSVVAIKVAEGFTRDDVLGLAASLDQASAHVVAASLIKAADAAGLTLQLPRDSSEVPGKGIEGVVGGHRVALGGDTYVSNRSQGGIAPALTDSIQPGALSVAVAIDGRVAGVIVLTDELREDALSTIASLREAGIRRIVLASGDRADVADSVGKRLGIDEIRAALSPEGKVDVVRMEAKAAPVVMVGDGVNDAPALAVADVGVAMGARGAAASSEAAGMVLLVDRLAPLAQSLKIARRTRAIALQSVMAGMTLTVSGMAVAALGYLPPVQGALLQEAIDIAVILNALRALR